MPFLSSILMTVIDMKIEETTVTPINKTFFFSFFVEKHARNFLLLEFLMDIQKV